MPDHDIIKRHLSESIACGEKAVDAMRNVRERPLKDLEASLSEVGGHLANTLEHVAAALDELSVESPPAPPTDPTPPDPTPPPTDPTPPPPTDPGPAPPDPEPPADDAVVLLDGWRWFGGKISGILTMPAVPELSALQEWTIELRADRREYDPAMSGDWPYMGLLAVGTDHLNWWWEGREAGKLRPTFDIEADPAPAVGEVAHLVLVRGASKFELYINGNRAAESVPDRPLPLAGPITIGGTRRAADNPQIRNQFKGWLGHVKVHRSALLADAIAALSAMTVPDHPADPVVDPPPPPPPPPPAPPPPAPPAEGEPTPPSTTSTHTVSPGVTSAHINSLPAQARIRFNPGTYENLTITPKNGQFYEGIGGSDAVILRQPSGSGRAFSGGAVGVFIMGLTVRDYSPGGLPRSFEQYAGTGNNQDNRSQVGVIQTTGGGYTSLNWTIHKCRIVNNHGTGIKLSNGMRISQCAIGDNAQAGINGRGRNVIIEHNDIFNNNRAGFNKSWDAAGIKIVGGAGNADQELPPANNIIIQRNLIHDNNSFGYWSDWDVFGVEIHNNSIYANAWSGLSLEASGTHHVHHNQIGDNMRGTPGHWLGAYELNWQSCKRSIFEKNLVVIQKNASSGAVYFSGHNRSGGSSQGGYRVGHFTCTENIFRQNVFLQRLGAEARFRRDFATPKSTNNNPKCTGGACLDLCGTSETGCRLVHPSKGILTDGIGGNAHCFVPAAGDNHLNSAQDNTYRSSGTPQTLPNDGVWGSETGRRLRGEPDAFLPVWTTLPTWDSPPGWS